MNGKANIFPHFLLLLLFYILFADFLLLHTLCNTTNRLSKCSALQRQSCLFALKLFLPLNILCYSIFICSLCYCTSLFLSSPRSHWWTVTMLFYLLCLFCPLGFLFAFLHFQVYWWWSVRKEEISMSDAAPKRVVVFDRSFHFEARHHWRRADNSSNSSWSILKIPEVYVDLFFMMISALVQENLLKSSKRWHIIYTS